MDYHLQSLGIPFPIVTCKRCLLRKLREARRRLRKKQCHLCLLAHNLKRLQHASGGEEETSQPDPRAAKHNCGPKPKAKSFVSKMKKKQTPVLKRPASSSKSASTGEMISTSDQRKEDPDQTAVHRIMSKRM